ncbi:MAG: PepSY-associated TM helix domain-containing protein, partial [Vicinamibacterales bacterium]
MNPTVRTVLFWCHLVAGVIAGVVILVMSVTGVLLAYERQMLAWADTRGIAVSADAGAQRLATADLLARVREDRPDLRPIALTVRADPRAPVAVNVGQRTLQVDPYTGEILGEGAQGLRTFFRSMTEWHRYLAMSGGSRTTGRAITGISNLAFLFIVASGPFLWWPR